MRHGRGNEIGYVETQLMIPRARKGEDTVITNVVSGGGKQVHAMYGYSYEIPDFSDTFFADPGAIEFNKVFYWQYIIPITTIVDRVSFYLNTTLSLALTFPIQFGLYNCNLTDSSFAIAARSEQIIAAGLGPGTHNLLLESRTTISPGQYILAYLAPCFFLLCIRPNNEVFRCINPIWPTLDRYGSFNCPEHTLPDAIDLTNGIGGGFGSATPIPISYWSDSQEFLAA